MKRTFDRTQLGPYCMICGKSNAMGQNKPHSQKRTKRVIRPNIQSYHGLILCTRCIRTIKSKEATQAQSATTA